MSQVRSNHETGERLIVLESQVVDGELRRREIVVRGPYVVLERWARLRMTEELSQWHKAVGHRSIQGFLVGRESALEPRDGGVFERAVLPRSITVAACCATVTGKPADRAAAEEHCRGMPADVTVLPEAYPFSHHPVAHVFTPGTVYGGYGEHGPLTWFVGASGPVPVPKLTSFANERNAGARGAPAVFRWIGLNVAVLVCYDLMNPCIAGRLTALDIDLIVVPAMVPYSDRTRWSHFLFVRGQECACPVVLVSGRDKRGICDELVLAYDPVAEKVSEFTRRVTLTFSAGPRQLRSPPVHWSWLLRNQVFGPFPHDLAVLGETPRTSANSGT